jgi:hypothetical protein
MAYIGKQPVVGNFQVCDAISVVNGQAAYTMQVASTNVEPENANHMLVSLNGVLQKPGSSFTISGATITFASNLATGDVIDFIILLGNVLDLGVPSDATVTNAKLASDVISGETDIGGAIADADLFLMDDGAGGTLRKTAASRIKTYVGSGLAEADQWRLTSDFASDAIITANLERTDTYGFGQLGTGMTESSGVFTFPSTGFYLIMYQGRILSNNYGNATLTIMVTTNNSDYNNAGMATQGNDGTGDDGTATGIYIVDVTSTTNVKVKFRTNSFGSGTTLRGNTDRSDTCFTFIKLGDT